MIVSRARIVSILFVVALCLLSPAIAAHEATPEPTPEATPATGPSREELHTPLPEMAPGYALTLTRVTIEPGGVAAAHTHPGMQLICIESGTIHYTVVSGGELPYTLAGEHGQPGVEGILMASLFAPNPPASIPIDVPTTPAS